MSIFLLSRLLVLRMACSEQSRQVVIVGLTHLMAPLIV